MVSPTQKSRVRRSSTKRTSFTNELQRITNPSIQRLARVAGVKSMESGVYEEVRDQIKSFLDQTLKRAFEYKGHKRETTLDVEAVKIGLPTKINDAGGLKARRCEVKSPKKRTSKSRKRRLKPGEKADKEMKFYRKNFIECLHLSMAGFKSLVREMGKNYNVKGNNRYTSDSIILLQYATESYVITLLNAGQAVAAHCGRIVLRAADISAARKVAEILTKNTKNKRTS